MGSFAFPKLVFYDRLLNITLRRYFSLSFATLSHLEQKNEIKIKPFKVCRRTTADDRIKKAASVGFGVHTKDNPKVEKVEKSTDVLRP